MKGHWQGVNVIDCASMTRLCLMETLSCELTRHYQYLFLQILRNLPTSIVPSVVSED